MGAVLLWSCFLCWSALLLVVVVIVIVVALEWSPSWGLGAGKGCALLVLSGPGLVAAAWPSPEGSRPRAVIVEGDLSRGRCLAAGGRVGSLGPGVHMCAAKAAERESFCRAHVGAGRTRVRDRKPPERVPVAGPGRSRVPEVLPGTGSASGRVGAPAGTGTVPAGGHEGGAAATDASLRNATTALPVPRLHNRTVRGAETRTPRHRKFRWRGG